MADRRRRRRQSDGESDEEQTEAGTVPENKPRISECESESEHHDADVDLSEYESANEDKGEDKGETEVTKKKEEKEEEEEEESEEEEDSEEEDSEDDDDDEAETYDGDDVTVEDDFDSCSFVDEERQSGDGEEQPEQDGDLDDDEDKKNPAYIPRKGAFYEHDMRIAAEIEESNKPKKKLWKEDNKWLHDCYREDQQAPKSREELVAMYGYDIRQYDKPPDAPPRSNRPRVRRTEDRPKFSDFLPERSERVRSSPQKDFVSNRNERSVNSPHRDFTHERDSYSPRYQQQQQQQSYRHDRDDNDYYPPRYNSQRDQGYDNDRSSRYSSQSDFVERKNNYNNAKSRGDRDRFTRYRGGDSNRRGRGGRGSDNRRRNNYSDGNDSGRGPRKFPPRFQRQQSPKQFNNYNNDGYEYDTQGNIPNVSSSEQTVDHQNLPAPDSFNLKQDEFPTFSPSGDRNVDNNDDINKENVNIVIQSSGDRKSYSKERKSKLTGRTRVQDFVANAVEQGISNLRLEDSGEQGDRQGGHIDDKPKSQSEGSRKNYNSQVNTASQIQKQDLSQQGKPKRYSSQRQRNVPDTVSYQDSVPVEGAANYYNPALAKGYNPPNPVTTSRYQQKTVEPQPKTPTTPTFPPPPQARPMLQAPIAYPLPVSAAGITSPPRGMPNPQRLPNPPQVFQPTAAAVSLSTAVPMVAPQYINNGVLYGTTPAPYQVPPGHIPPPAPVPIQGFPSPPDVTAAPPPQRPSQPPFRSGTTYYSPELQYQGKHRSPVRRPKAAIPIVNPQDIKKKDLVDKEGDTSEGLESEIYHDAEMESTANLINSEESETVLEHESNINVQSDLSPCQTDSDIQKQEDHPPVKEQISAVDSPVPLPPPPPDSGEVASIPVKETVEAAT